MATFTVTTAADTTNAGDGVLSLREAVQQANASAEADTIVFANALEGQTLTLTQGQLTLTNDVSIDGDQDNNGSKVTISGNDLGRVVGITGTGTDATLTDLVVRDGLISSGEGGGINLAGGNSLALLRCNIQNNAAGSPDDAGSGSGAGIFAGVGSQLVVTDSIVTGNEAPRFNFCGGILANGATVRISDSILENNSGYGAGGIALTNNSYLSLDQSIIRGNIGAYYKGGYGGGIYASSSRLVLRDSTISSNSARYDGGGIYLRDTEASIDRCTIADNTSSDFYGGGSTAGVAVEGVSLLTLDNSTVTGNTSGDQYGGPGGIEVGNDARMLIANTIVAGNFGTSEYNPVASDVSNAGTIVSNGHNIFGSDVTGAITSDLENISASSLFAALDPDTGGGVLALNGGPTPTVALRNALDNPALSAADPITAGDTDQRGLARPNPASSLSDIGAFELTQSALSTTASDGNDVLTGTANNDSRNGQDGVDLLLGLAGNDTLNGDSGNDTLRGGLGNDALIGGAGLDTASYRDATTAVTVSLASNTSTGALGADTLSGIEHLEGGSGGDGLTGDGLGNSLGGRLGNDLLYGLTGNDRLYGGAGDDLLEGGFGDDWLDGGEGVDTVSYFNDTYPLAVTIDLFTQTVTRSGETDRLRDVENADGTNNADTITGNVAVNRLGGAGGDDVIRGLGGDDLLNGGLGNDVLDGDLGLDLADYGQGAAVTVNLSGTTDTATRGTEVDTLREIEGAIGSGSNDVLIGDALANVFRAQGGKDTLTGGAGADLFDLDATAHSAAGANRDVITDFTPGSDDLDLATIDAKSATAGVNDAFTFLAAKGAAFTGAGQVRWYQSGGVTLVEANVDANLAPDLQVQLTGLKTLTLADFVL